MILHIIIFSIIEDIWCVQEALRDFVVSIMIEELYGRKKLSGFNHNKLREVL